MKKIFFSLLLAPLALVGCQKGVPEANLKTSADSMFYAIGVTQSADTATLGQFLRQMQSESKFLDDFLDGLAYGVEEGYNAMDKVKETTDKKERAYAAGIMQGVEFGALLGRVDSRLFDEADMTEAHRNFVAGFADFAHQKVKINYNGKPLDVTTAGKFSEEMGMRLEEPKLLKEFGKVKEAGEAFLTAKRKEAGVQVLPSGVLYKVLAQGAGVKPKAEDRVAVRYTGRLTDGKVFDATAQHPGVQADTFGVAQVIPGWTEALQQMPVGSKWEVYIPYRQAYGTRASKEIKPFSALIFEIELLGVVK